MTGMITRGVHTYLPLSLYTLQAGGSLVVTNDTDLSVEISRDIGCKSLARLSVLLWQK
jgi:hypothetical protein